MIITRAGHFVGCIVVLIVLVVALYIIISLGSIVCIGGSLLLLSSSLFFQQLYGFLKTLIWLFFLNFKRKYGR